MAFNIDTDTFYTEFYQGDKLYRLELIPYSTTLLTATTANELPSGALVKDSINFNTAYENNIRIGMKPAGEMSFTIQGDNLTGDFEDVFNWIVKRGEYQPTSATMNYLTNRWVLKRYNDTLADWENMFIGWQLTTGDSAEIEIDPDNERYSYEVKCVDGSVAIFADTILSSLIAYARFGEFSPNYCAGLYAHGFYSVGGNVRLDRQLISLENREEFFNGDPNPVAEFRNCYRFMSIKNFFLQIKNYLTSILIEKYRLQPSLTFFDDIFVNFKDIYNDYTFYRWIETYNVPNKGTALTEDDVVFVARVQSYEDGTYTTEQDVNEILNFENAYDIYKNFCEVFLKFMKRDLNTYANEAWEFLAVDDYTTNLTTLTTSDIVNKFKGNFLQNISAKQAFHFKSISDLDKTSEEIIEDATVLSQESIEIDAIVDNFVPQIALENINENNKLQTAGTATIYYSWSGTTARSNTNKYNSLMYIRDWMVNSNENTQIASQVCNVVTRDSVDYGDVLTNPDVYGQNINSSDAVKLRAYIKEAQDNSGIAIAWAEILSSLYSPNYNSVTFTMKIKMESFDSIMSKYGFDVCGIPVYIDLPNFIPNALAINNTGYISAVKSIDLRQNIIECEIILNKAV